MTPDTIRKRIQEILGQATNEKAILGDPMYQDWPKTATTALEALVSEAIQAIVFTSDPDILGGAPCIRGTRIPKERLKFLVKENPYTAVASLTAEYDMDRALAEIVVAAINAEQAKLGGGDE